MELKAMSRELRDFKHALLVRNVVARAVAADMTEEAMEFPTEEALRDYLKEHPRAKAKNHSVKRPKHDDKAEPLDKEVVERFTQHALSSIKMVEHMLEGHKNKEDVNYVQPLSQQIPHQMSSLRHFVNKMQEGINHIPQGKERERAKEISKKIDEAIEAPNQELGGGARWDHPDRKPDLGPNSAEKMLNTLKPLVHELDQLFHGQRTLMAHRVAIRVADMTEEAMEFSTPEALEKYLKEHPKADKSKHTVKKTEEQGAGSGPAESKPKRYDHPEFKDKSSPYYVNPDNKWLQKLGDPATWNYNEAQTLRNKLTDQPLLQGTPAEKSRSEAIRQITNWGMLVHQRNPSEVDKDMGMG